jgi:thiosulfate dehydrogenase [quinone] large subunit
MFLNTKAMKKEHVAYLLARLPMGLSFFGHGLIRITKLETFSSGMVKQFDKSILPGPFVSAFGHVLPFLEFITGLLILLGLFTRYALVLGTVIILILIAGSSIIEQWNAIFTQLFYGAYLAVLHYFTHYNTISIDGRFNRLA